MRRLHPRSPYEKLGGYVHLPRLIDKARLHRKGLLDGYNYKTVGFDKHLLSFLKIDGDAFEALHPRKEIRELCIRRDHRRPASRSSALLLVACRFLINNSIASRGGSAAIVLRSNCTRSHSSGW